ncbi:hypothetical protein [Micromonospora sp. CPCC 206061]|uniref:hypothetical protein n=1 Tax=Micromonospora sp. CPCC 206061 TaxID=3122410 RepID=UPI002FF24A16
MTLFASPSAAAVRYRYSDGPGTVVDTVLPMDITVRTERDPCVDRDWDDVAKVSSRGEAGWDRHPNTVVLLLGTGPS